MSVEKNILNEVTPLSDKDCFIIIERKKTHFDYPLHVHRDFELNYVENAAHAQRIIGDSVEEIGDQDLVLITDSNLEHAWVNHQVLPGDIYEITIQFHPELFQEGFVNKNQFLFIRQMLEKAQHGLLFSPEVIRKVKPILMDLVGQTESFRKVLIFLSLLNELARDERARILSHSIFAHVQDNYDSRRVKKVMEFLSANYKEPIKLQEMASMVNMSEASFSRFIKLRTGKNFVDCLNDIRISAAVRDLVDSPGASVAEIAYSCGFNNLSNFNRIFKKKKGFTPKDFREYYMKKKTIV